VTWRCTYNTGVFNSLLNPQWRPSHVFSPSKVRLGFSNERGILSGIHTNAFHRFFVVETKRSVGSTVNVILTRQTCGQRSSGAAESKRRAPGNYFPEWICYMFLLSKCGGDWGQGLCTFCVLAKREPLRNGDCRKKNVFRPQKKTEFGIAQRFSFCKYPNSAQT